LRWTVNFNFYSGDSNTKKSTNTTLKDNNSNSFANKVQNNNNKHTPRSSTSALSSEQDTTTSNDQSDTAGITLSNLKDFGNTIETLYHTFKRLFQGLNLMKILTRVQQGLSTLPPNAGLLVTLSTVVQIIVSIVDDGSE